MNENEVKGLKAKVQHGPVYGTLLSLPSPEIAEVMALAGFDWLFIDMEHGAFDTTTCQRMLQAVGERCSALVRIPELTESAIKKVLDAGAEGIIVPRVNTAEEADVAVKWSKYAPLGMRGVGATRAHAYGLRFQEYVSEANDRLMVVLQIEDIEGVRNIDSILQVEGIDIIFIGPYDLSASMGLMGQVDHPDVMAAIRQVEEACQAKGVPMGYFGMTTEAVKPYVNKGYKLITCGTDAGFLVTGVQDVLASLKS